MSVRVAGVEAKRYAILAGCTKSAACLNIGPRAAVAAAVAAAVGTSRGATSPDCAGPGRCAAREAGLATSAGFASRAARGAGAAYLARAVCVATSRRAIGRIACSRLDIRPAVGAVIEAKVRATASCRHDKHDHKERSEPPEKADTEGHSEPSLRISAKHQDVAAERWRFRFGAPHVADLDLKAKRTAIRRGAPRFPRQFDGVPGGS